MKQFRSIHEALMDCIQAGRSDEAYLCARLLAMISGRLP